MKNRNLLVLSIFLLTGWGAAVGQARGALLKPIQDTFLVSESVLGLTAPVIMLGFMVSVLTIGMIIGRINIRKFLLIGTGLSFISLILLGSSPFFFLLLGFFFVSGISGGLTTALCPPILGHMHSKKRGWIFNRNEMVWAIGATSGPLFVNLILVIFGSWRLAYFLLSLGFIPIFLLFWKIRLTPDMKREKALSLKELKSLGKHPAVFGMALGIAVNSCIEGSLFTWLAYYMTQFFPEDIANLIFSGYMMAYIPSRLIYGRLSGKTGYTNLILFNSVVTVFLLFLAFFVTSGAAMVACIFVIGFLISGNFPTLLAMGTNARPEHSGPINGIARSAAALGISTFSALIGVIADLSGLRSGMQLLIFPTIAMCVIIFAINRKTQN
jgi:MFS family permease